MVRRRTYKRDKRSPIPESPTTSHLMSSIKGKDTCPELRLRRALRDAGLYGYRVHLGTVPGRPDIAFPKYKVVIFVHGCFWHRCPVCGLHAPKVHSEYWQAKFDRNVERDSRKRRELEHMGWTVITCWEHEIKGSPEKCVDRIRSAITNLRENNGLGGIESR